MTHVSHCLPAAPPVPCRSRGRVTVPTSHRCSPAPGTPWHLLTSIFSPFPVSQDIPKAVFYRDRQKVPQWPGDAHFLAKHTDSLVLHHDAASSTSWLPYSLPSGGSRRTGATESSASRWPSRSKATTVLSWDGGQAAPSNCLPSKALAGAVPGRGEGVAVVPRVTHRLCCLSLQEVGPTMVGDEHSDPGLMSFLGATKRNMLGNHL